MYGKKLYIIKRLYIYMLIVLYIKYTYISNYNHSCETVPLNVYAHKANKKLIHRW